MKTAVVINEQHNLFPGQEEILNTSGLDWEKYPVPATGWTIEQQMEHACSIGKNYGAVIIVSPVPAFIMKLAMLVEARNCERQAGFPLVPQGASAPQKVFLFSKEKREKKEYLVDGGNVQISSKLNDEFVLVEIQN